MSGKRKHYEDILERRDGVTGQHAEVIAAVLSDDLDAVKHLLGENSQLLISVIVFASMYPGTAILRYAMDRAMDGGSVFYATMIKVVESCSIAANFSECYENY